MRWHETLFARATFQALALVLLTISTGVGLADAQTTTKGIAVDSFGNAYVTDGTSERPRVGVGKIRVFQKLAHATPMMVEVPVLNTGLTPALYTQCWAVLFPQFVLTHDQKFLPPPQIADCLRPKRTWSNNLHGDIVTPGGTTHLALTSEVLSDWAVDAANAQDNRKVLPLPLPTPLPSFLLVPSNAALDSLGMFIVGCTEYFDSWHKAHRTTFCAIYNPRAQAFGPCDAGNSAE